ncbi:20090_t:CDS:2, partial [Gigaspora rosea]
LGNLSDNPGATKQRKRVGRGPASGHGKTCGRGQKGQKARGGNGKPRRGFEGGQTSISVAFPKRGFHNRNEKTYAPLNLDRLQHWINTGRIDPSQTITMKHLLDTRCVHGVKDGVKLLADVV